MHLDDTDLLSGLGNLGFDFDDLDPSGNNTINEFIDEVLKKFTEDFDKGESQ